MSVVFKPVAHVHRSAAAFGRVPGSGTACGTCGVCERRIVDVRWTYMTSSEEATAVDTVSRRRSRRMDLRTTSEERELIDRAVLVSGTDLTEFVVSHASDAARRILADRDEFNLDASALEQWDQLNARPARDLPGLRRLMQRRSPFTE